MLGASQNAFNINTSSISLSNRVKNARAGFVIGDTAAKVGFMGIPFI